MKMTKEQEEQLAVHAKAIEAAGDWLMALSAEFREEWDGWSERKQTGEEGQACLNWIECLDELADATTEAASNLANADTRPS